jgi:hypothetical protein
MSKERTPCWLVGREHERETECRNAGEEEEFRKGEGSLEI